MQKTNTNIEYSRSLPSWGDFTECDNESEDKKFDNENESNGYPRWCLHKSVKRLCDVLNNKYAKENERCLCFPSYGVAKRCREFVRERADVAPKVRILQLATSKPNNVEEKKWKCEYKIAIVFVSAELFPLVRKYWRLTGEIVSPRLAEYVLNELFIAERSSFSTFQSKKDQVPAKRSQLNFTLANRAIQNIRKKLVAHSLDTQDEFDEGNYHFQNEDSVEPTFLDTVRSNDSNNQQQISQIDEDLIRFGLSRFDDASDNDSDEDRFQSAFGNESESEEDDQFVSLVPAEPIEIDISNTPIDSPLPDNSNNASATFLGPGHLNHNTDIEIDYNEDVFIFPTGMASLYTAQRYLLEYDLMKMSRLRFQSDNDLTNGNNYKRMVLLGELTQDNTDMMKEFNETIVINNKKGMSETLDDLEVLLNSGEQILGLFTEIPTNPHIGLIDLERLKDLSNLFVFPIIFDITAGSGVLNCNVLKYGDILCTSLLTRFTNIEVNGGAMIISKKRTPKMHEFFLDKMNEELTESQLASSTPQPYSRNLLNTTGTTIWVEDVILLDKGSSRWHDRNIKINYTTEYLIQKVLKSHQGTLFKNILYLNDIHWKENGYYDMIKYSREDCGYGGIFTLEFNDETTIEKFYNALENIYKGTPLLGGNEVTMVTAFKNKTCDEYFMRVCVGLENIKTLTRVFQTAISKC
ncbi:Cystathionine gamma-synthase [Nakaseomyces bracarensis]|uniref:Cystathionine gamma-synthase n=1 Tax=Nakaseomyces bracarensis TaxID=273131 RepID=UPI0038721A9F